MYARRLVVCCMLLPILGCNMKGSQGNSSTGLEGDWTLYAPFSKNPGSVNFDGKKFKETFALGNGADAAVLVISGDYAVANSILHLTNEEFEINKSVSFEAMTLRETIKKQMGADFAMEWTGNNVLYLTSSVAGTGSQASSVLGLSRNGGQVDQKKVAMSLEATGGGGGSVTLDTNNGGTSNTGSDQSASNQPLNQTNSPGSPQVDPTQNQNQYQAQNQNQTPPAAASASNNAPSQTPPSTQGTDQAPLQQTQAPQQQNTEQNPPADNGQNAGH